MSEKDPRDTPESPAGRRSRRPPAYYDAIKEKFARERDLRLGYRPEGTAQFTSDLTGALERYEVDPNGREVEPRAAIEDTVEVLIIGGGFSALLTSALSPWVSHHLQGRP